jgi:hypothetical protein
MQNRLGLFCLESIFKELQNGVISKGVTLMLDHDGHQDDVSLQYFVLDHRIIMTP